MTLPAGRVCPYCGYAAEVTKTDGSISYHRTAAAAIAAADGGTVKLLANAGAITISSPLKLDLNGKTAAKLTVTGDVTLAPSCRKATRSRAAVPGSATLSVRS